MTAKLTSQINKIRIFRTLMSPREHAIYSGIATRFSNTFSGNLLHGLEIFERKMFWYVAS